MFRTLVPIYKQNHRTSSCLTLNPFTRSLFSSTVTHPSSLPDALRSQLCFTWPFALHLPCWICMDRSAVNSIKQCQHCHCQSRSRGAVCQSGQIVSSCIGKFPLTRSQPHLLRQEEQKWKIREVWWELTTRTWNAWDNKKRGDGTNWVFGRMKDWEEFCLFWAIYHRFIFNYYLISSHPTQCFICIFYNSVLSMSRSAVMGVQREDEGAEHTAMGCSAVER